MMFDINYKTTTTIIDDVIDTPANNYTYYTFSVPAGASSAKVTGNYEVHSGGLIPRIDIYLADTSLCSSPIDCSYSTTTSARTSHLGRSMCICQLALEADKQLIISPFITLPHWARANRRRRYSN